MSDFKFLRFTVPSSPYFSPLIEQPWFQAWHHYWNPFGNWEEPRAFPEKHAEAAKKSPLPADLWWAIRNPLHNFTHHWIGITPLGKRYEWISLEEAGWEKIDGYWTRDGVRRKSFTGKGYGWQSRGSFRMSTGNKKADIFVLVIFLAVMTTAIVEMVS